MLRRIICSALAVLAAVTMTPATVETAAGSQAAPGANAGPPYHFVTELMGQFPFVPLEGTSILARTKLGYRFRTGQQNSHLVLARVAGGIRFADTGTQSFKTLSPSCRRQKVRVGIAAVCRVPRTISTRRPLLVEVWPRLGNDFTDASTLPATFAVTVLGDGGNDVARLGAGPDFFNGHSGRDLVTGGAGNDWIRAGLGDDAVQGGRGNDDLVAMQGHDTVSGGDGSDRVGGGDGDDRLWGNAGTDWLLCGTGRDTATVGSRDRGFDCESIKRG